MKSQSTVATVYNLQEINSLTQREVSHGPENPPLQYPTGLKTRFFNPTPKLTSYTNIYGYGYGSSRVKGMFER
jgi:hypothetical protein